MNKKNVILIVAGLVIIIAAAIVMRMPKKSRPQGGDCEVTEVKMAMPDHLLQGIIEKDQEITVQMGYYACRPVEKGDIVLFRISTKMDPVVKIVRAVQDDEFELIADKVHNAWNIEINGDLLKAGDTPYFFGSNAKPTLSLYTKDGKKGVIKDDDMIIFSNLPPGEKDSGIIGLTNKQDILGKVVVKK